MKQNFYICILACLLAYAVSQTSEPKSELEEKCKLEAEPGNGTDESIRFFFDESTQKCQNFTYTGEGGNENNFETELDCLNDCFVGVESEGTPQNEEDVVFVEKDQPVLEFECDKPKETGNGKDSIQKFYYNPKWRTCFAFKYSGEGGNGNRFSTRAECESNCLVADGSVCTGPSGSKELLKIGGNCDEAECSEGHKCANGLRGPECCVKDELDAIEEGFSDTCPDGTKADGIFEDYFQATFAESCDDLICGDGKSCVQVNKHFAKCCGGEKRLADDIPVSAGALHVQIDDCHYEEKRALRECQKFLTEIDIARRISNSKRMFVGAASILREFNFACSKYEEYKTCIGLITKNAGCLNPKLAVKEQLLNFVCQENVREAMANENEPCINALSESPKVKECETAMRRSLEDSNGNICHVLDQSLSCTKSELLSCGKNTLSYVTNIVTTIKANIDECDNNESEISGDSGSERSFVKTVITRPGFTVTEIKTAPSDSTEESNRSKKQKPKKFKKPRNVRPSPKCPSSIIRQTSLLCFPLLSSRSVKQILNPIPGEFLLAKFNPKNIEQYCKETSRYRKCLENLYSSEESCYSQLKEDAFYSFIIAFDDKLCDEQKQLEYLINSQCLEETVHRSQIRRCLYRSGAGEDKLLCKTKKQLTDCVMDSIITRCRMNEIKYFEKILENLEIRSHFCIPNFETDEDDGNDQENEDNDDDRESGGSRQSRKHGGRSKETADADAEESDKIVTQECLRARQIAFIREDSYIPECKENGEFQPMQCNRQNGSCFCVDEITGEISRKSVNGPGDPLPLCGLKALFTCERLPSKLFCEVDGTIAQKTERWYRRGDRCSMYLYDYCPQQSHIPPIPLRSKSDCERFCLPKCLRARQIAFIREDSYIPECKENGEFQPMQCDRQNGSCFCVDETTGEISRKSVNGPGDPLPLCGSLFTCERIPSKLFCEVDGTIAQKTERWYRRGDRCSMYLYDYCPQQSHIPPIPLRSKSDCERFCLPSN